MKITITADDGTTLAEARVGVMRLLAIGALLRAGEVWDRFSAWLLEPAERREHDRWQQERHAAALAELSPGAAAAAETGIKLARRAHAYMQQVQPFQTPVEPWHGKASGCA